MSLGFISKFLFFGLVSFKKFLLSLFFFSFPNISDVIRFIRQRKWLMEWNWKQCSKYIPWNDFFRLNWICARHRWCSWLGGCVGVCTMCLWGEREHWNVWLDAQNSIPVSYWLRCLWLFVPVGSFLFMFGLFNINIRIHSKRMAHIRVGTRCDRNSLLSKKVVHEKTLLLLNINISSLIQLVINIFGSLLRTEFFKNLLSNNEWMN